MMPYMFLVYGNPDHVGMLKRVRVFVATIPEPEQKILDGRYLCRKFDLFVGLPNALPDPGKVDKSGQFIRP